MVTANFNRAFLCFTNFGDSNDFSVFWVLKRLRNHAIRMWHSREVKEVVGISIALVLQHPDFAVFEVRLNGIPIFRGRHLILLLGSLRYLDYGIDIVFVVSFTVNIMPRTKFPNHHKFHSHITSLLVIWNQLGIELSQGSKVIALAQVGYTFHLRSRLLTAHYIIFINLLVKIFILDRVTRIL